MGRTLEVLSTSNIFSPYKILTYPEVLMAAKAGAALPPINLEINLTNTCNQSCTWCTYGYLHERREELKPELIIDLLRESKELGVQSVTWTGGGEPTVYKHLVEVVSAAVECGFAQGMNTNGSRLNERLMELLTDNFSYVRFSVDAGTSETYSRTHRVPINAYDKIIANISTLVEKRNQAGSKLTVGFSFLVDNSNVGDMAGAARLAKSIGVDYFQLKPIVNYIESNVQFEATSRLWEAMEAQLDETFALEDEKYKVHFLGHKFTDIKLQQQYYGRTYNQCRGNELLATVGADGSVDVCCAYKGHKDWSFGNLNETGFKEIWASEQRSKVLGQIDVAMCPPLCKAHEINKLLHYVGNFDAHKEFV